MLEGVMKTVVIYGTKYGYTERCAKILVTKLGGEVDLFNITQLNNIELTKYERVVIGGPVYIGKIHKAIQRFCHNNLEILTAKKLGLFICCMKNGDEARAELDSVFPRELLAKAVATENFGGELVFNKMNFGDRLLTKLVTKSVQDQFNHLDENINQFIALIN